MMTPEPVGDGELLERAGAGDRERDDTPAGQSRKPRGSSSWTVELPMIGGVGALPAPEARSGKALPEMGDAVRRPNREAAGVVGVEARPAPPRTKRPAITVLAA